MEDFSEDDAQDYLDDFADVISTVIQSNGFQKIAADAIANAIVNEYKFRDLCAELWNDGEYSGFADTRANDGSSLSDIYLDDVKQNPFQNECCPTTKGGGHKFRCPQNGVQQMVVPVNVTETDEGEVSEVWRTRVFDGKMATPKPQDRW